MATNGLFTVAITDAQIISKVSGSGTGQVWLELIVGNDTFPRQLATPGLFSIMSAQADNATNASQLGGTAASAYALKSQLTGGTVTSVASGTGLSGGPITTSGTLSVVFAGTGSAGSAAHSDHTHGMVCMAVSAATAVTCPGSYYLMGGGCVVSGSGGIKSSYPSSNSWQCDVVNAGDTVTAYARCCYVL